MTMLVLIGATLLIGLVLQDAFEVMLLPRRIRRRLRVMRLYLGLGWRCWAWLGRRIVEQRERERVLSLFGPISMVGLFVIWTAALLVGFAGLLWALESDATGATAFGRYLYMSGVTLLTLGYGDVVPHTGAAKAVVVIEAANGFGLIAVVIGYLPVLYQLFSRREVHVIQLDARAGSPPTSGTLLCRHAGARALPKLDDLLRDWERWCAELLESHLSYPMLSFYRSQHDNQNWLAALAAIMDGCVLMMVGLRDVDTFQAKMTFAMARMTVVDMCRVFSLSARPPADDRLPPAAFGRLAEMLRENELDWLEPSAASGKIAEFRATYEPFLCSLATYLLIALPPWVPESGGDEITDNWQRSARGRSAKRLVEDAPGLDDAPAETGRPDAASLERIG